MKWFPFQIGWLNLWILTLVFQTRYLMSMGERGKAALKRAGWPSNISISWGEQVFALLVMMPFPIYLYTIFVPFTANTALLGAGLLLFVVGFVLILKATWDITIAPPDKLITNGIYQISRNPVYFGMTLTYLGMGLAGASWLIVAYAVFFFIGYQWVATIEERSCMESWPEEFAEYKRRVAKNLLFF